MASHTLQHDCLESNIIYSICKKCLKIQTQTTIYKILQRQPRLIKRTSLKTGGKLRCSITLSSSCSNSVTCRVVLGTNTGISQAAMMTGPDCRIVITTNDHILGHLWHRYFVIGKIISKYLYIMNSLKMPNGYSESVFANTFLPL